MWKTSLLVALRTLRRQKGYAALNVLGLALGLACALLIGLYVADELSYDRAYPHADRLYRIDEQPEAGTRWGATSVMHAPALKAEFAEVEQAVRLFTRRFVLGTDRAQLDGVAVAWADPEVVDVFGLRLVEGTAVGMLTRPGTIVLTRATKERLFGDSPALGKTVRRENAEDLEVSGVVERPANSHLYFDALVPFETVWRDFAWLPQWTASTTETYVRLRAGANPATVEARLPAYLARHVENLEPDRALFLAPITDLRLRPATTGDTGTLGTIRLFALVGLLVLLLAGINYVNLATARAADRMKEVGMRKLLGARRLGLTLQLLGESVLLTLAGYAVALLIARLALPPLNTLAEKQLALFGAAGLPLTLAFAGVAVAVGVSAGMYPALYLSRFRPVQVLKGRNVAAGRGRLRQALVVVQFVVTITLVVGTLVVRAQLRYLGQQDLGFSGDQVVSVRQQGDAAAMQTLREELLRLPQVRAVGMSSAQPGNIGWQMSVADVGADASAPSPMFTFMLADAGYVPAMEMAVLAGRNFAGTTAEVGRALLLNASAARQLGFADPARALGKHLDVGQYEDAEVVGIVKDFHYASLRQEVEPIVIAYDPPNTSRLSVKLAGNDLPNALNALAATWQRVVPGWPLTYSFVDEDFAALYQSDQRMSRLVGVFAGLAIFIACLGLFGLAAYVAERRTKEIGVRKVLGATVPSLVGLLNREFLALVLVGFALATPLAYLAVSRWLETFATRVPLSVWPFVLAGGAAFVLALVTVSVHAIRAASTDPVKALRYE